MKIFRNVDVAVTVFSTGIALITGLKKRRGREFTLNRGISEIFAFCEGEAALFCFDLQNIRLLDGSSWSALFGEAEKDDVKLIYLFNANGAILAAAKQLKMKKKTDAFSKVKVLTGDSEVREIFELI